MPHAGSSRRSNARQHHRTSGSPRNRKQEACRSKKLQAEKLHPPPLANPIKRRLPKTPNPGRSSSSSRNASKLPALSRAKRNPRRNASKLPALSRAKRNPHRNVRRRGRHRNPSSQLPGRRLKRDLPARLKQRATQSQKVEGTVRGGKCPPDVVENSKNGPDLGLQGVAESDPPFQRGADGEAQLLGIINACLWVLAASLKRQ